MTTRKPSAVQGFTNDTLEKIAYTSVESIPVREPNDHARLGYHIWLFLAGKIPTLDEAIHDAHCRLLITESDASALIAKKLKERGIQGIP